MTVASEGFSLDGVRRYRDLQTFSVNSSDRDISWRIPIAIPANRTNPSIALILLRILLRDFSSFTADNGSGALLFAK